MKGSGSLGIDRDRGGASRGVTTLTPWWHTGPYHDGSIGLSLSRAIEPREMRVRNLVRFHPVIDVPGLLLLCQEG